MRSTVIAMLLTAGQAWSAPVATALADARSLPPAIAQQTRYLTLDTLPVAERAEVRRATEFWANSLSSSPDLTRPRLVGPDMVAVYLAEYGWSPKTWDGFAAVDPYYTVRIKTAWPGGVWPGDGKHYPAGSFSVTKTASAPWLDAKAMAELYALTGSKAPILRADWWLAQVAVQADRRVGYYDMLGVGKKRADFEAIVGLDRAKAIKLRKEIAAIVDVSVVALHNRQLYRFQTLNGAYWESRDVNSNAGQRNAVRFLNGDYKHDAEEIYGTLPNGLFAFFLSDASGVRADTAPDSIASDGRSASSDCRVHVGLSCVRCHVEGIRPIDCWARRTYAAPDQLIATDPARFLRLRQLYLSDLERLVKRDQSDYAAALQATNGLSPGDNAKIVAGVWERYVERPLDLTAVAREMGTTPDALTAALKGQAGIVDPVLLALGKGQSLRREHVEEMWPVLMGLK